MSAPFAMPRHEDEDEHHNAVPAGCTIYASKAAMYATIQQELEALVSTTTPLMTALGNASALLYFALNSLADPDARLQSAPVNWCGFYLMATPSKMALGPFQGKVACQEINVGRGVCGTAVLQKKHQLVPDVHKFPGHIACDGASAAEIVMVLRDGGNIPGATVVGVLDIDSTRLNHFTDEDLSALETFCDYLGRSLKGKFPICIAQQQQLQSSTTSAPHAIASGLQATRLPTAAQAFKIEATTAIRPPPSTATACPPGPHSHAAPLSTTVANQPKARLPAEPRIQTLFKGGWELRSTALDTMMPSAAFPELESHCDVKMLPEIIFGANSIDFLLPVVPLDQPHRYVVSLRICARDALKGAAEAYQQPEQRAGMADIKVPIAGAWAKRFADYETFKPNIDWTFRSNYMGTWRLFDIANRSGAAPVSTHGSDAPTFTPITLAPSADRINYDMLKRRDLTIEQYESMDLFEDDLHDHGLVRLSTKYRVMNTCFFVLLRYKLVLHGDQLRLRDVRVYHEFDTPKVLVEVSERLLTVADGPRTGLSVETLKARIASGDEEQQEFVVLKEEHLEYVLPPRAPGHAVAGGV